MREEGTDGDVEVQRPDRQVDMKCCIILHIESVMWLCVSREDV